MLSGFGWWNPQSLGKCDAFPLMVSKMALFTEFFSSIFIALQSTVLQSQSSQSYLTHTEHGGRRRLMGEMDLNPDLYVSNMHLIS